MDAWLIFQRRAVKRLPDVGAAAAVVNSTLHAKPRLSETKHNVEDAVCDTYCIHVRLLLMISYG